MLLCSTDILERENLLLKYLIPSLAENIIYYLRQEVVIYHQNYFDFVNYKLKTTIIYLNNARHEGYVTWYMFESLRKYYLKKRLELQKEQN